MLFRSQTQAIPAANEQVEFNHNQEVQSDLVGFNEATSDVASEGEPKSIKIQMGTSYPTRLFFINPPQPGGEIRTAGDESVSIYNINATDENTRKYIDGSMENLSTRRLEYDPTYNEYRSAPVTVVEYGAVYRDFEDATIIDDESELVRGQHHLADAAERQPLEGTIDRALARGAGDERPGPDGPDRGQRDGRPHQNQHPLEPRGIRVERDGR